MKSKLRCTFILLAIAWCIQAQNLQSKPNIVLILADDLGYEDLGCYGSKVIKTPVLDKMTKEGLKLTRHYSTAVCAPTRATLMTR